MDEGDEYVPQISQMNYNLMNDMTTGNSSFYEQQQQTPSIGTMQMYGTASVSQSATPSASSISQQQQQSYANYHRQQQLIQGNAQSNMVPSANQQQRYFIQQQHQMQPGLMPQHSMQSPRFSPSMNVPPVIDMNSIANVTMNKMPSHPLQGPSQTSVPVSTSLNTPGKGKGTRKSKKAAAAAAAAETAAANNNSSVTDPRGFYFIFKIWCLLIFILIIRKKLEKFN